MTDSKKPPFGLRRDGSIDRRDFLRTAGRLGVGAFGMSSLGLAGVADAQQPFNIGWVRPTTGRLASSLSYLYIRGPGPPPEDKTGGWATGAAESRHRGGRGSSAHPESRRSTKKAGIRGKTQRQARPTTHN